MVGDWCQPPFRRSCGGNDTGMRLVAGGQIRLPVYRRVRFGRGGKLRGGQTYRGGLGGLVGVRPRNKLFPCDQAPGVVQCRAWHDVYAFSILSRFTTLWHAAMAVRRSCATTRTEAGFKTTSARRQFAARGVSAPWGFRGHLMPSRADMHAKLTGHSCVGITRDKKTCNVRG
jgi:hypothetical protein